MVSKEKLFRMFEGLDEGDQKKAYEFIQSLARNNGENIPDDEVMNLFGKNYYVIPD